MCILCSASGGRGANHSTGLNPTPGKDGDFRGSAGWVDATPVNNPGNAAPWSGGGEALLDFLAGHPNFGQGGPNGSEGGGFPNLAHWGNLFLGGRDPGVRDVDTSSERGGLATNFLTPPGGETEDTGPGSGGDTIAGNSTTTSVLTIGAPAVTQWINSASDQDWFKVTLTAGTYYEFTMDPDGSLDAVIEIRGGPTGAVLLGSADGPLGPDTEVLGFYCETSGDYFIKADGFTTSTGQYTLSGVVAPTPTTCSKLHGHFGVSGKSLPAAAMISTPLSHA